MYNFRLALFTYRNNSALLSRNLPIFSDVRAPIIIIILYVLLLLDKKNKKSLVRVRSKPGQKGEEGRRRGGHDPALIRFTFFQLRKKN